MDIFDHKINKQFIAGNFPTEELSVPAIGDIIPIVFKESYEKDVDIVKKNIKDCPALLPFFKNRFDEVSKIQGLFTESVVNMLINTGFEMDEINENSSSYHKAIKLIPFVTEIDCILWMAATIAYNTCSFGVGDEFEDSKALLYTWIYLLREVEDKEAKYGITINPSVYENDSVIDLLVGDWDKKDSKVFIALTKTQQEELNKLIEDRKLLCQQIEKDLLKGREYAQNTFEDWKTFIAILNDLSKKEQEVFENIKKAISSKEKSNAFNGYEKAIYNIEHGKYSIGDKEVNLLELFEVVLERYKLSAPYCKVAVENGDPFRLHYAAVNLAMDPRTYNYYVMKYHQLRLSPGKDYARKFASLSLELLCKNIGSQYDKLLSVDEIIEKYKNTVDSFVAQNQSVIDSLKYDCIQMDSVSLGFSEQGAISELAIRDLKRQMSVDKNKTIDEIVSEDITAAIAEMELREEKIEEIVKARQIVISLNMIYLFANAIGIMLTDRHISVINNKEKAEKTRYSLLRTDAKIANKVYSDISDDSMSIQEYRERNAIDTTIISEKEKQADLYSSEVFAEVLQTNISCLVKDLKSFDIDRLLETKKSIIHEISLFPLSRDKELYADWVDQICSEICEAMVLICKNQSDDYDTIKKELKEYLGDDATILPEDTMDALTTAEILYQRYASDEYANRGFDYSSISALYYQSFEAAYNTLIWSGYSNILNTVENDGESFIRVVTKKGSSKSFPGATSYHKYLGTNLTDIKKYILFKNENMGIMETIFTPYCMYGPFSKLMKNINTGLLGTGFREYFSSVIGFNNPDEMINDKEYMDKLSVFTSSIENSKDNRNKASHGGVFISINQCTEDKKTVLDNLEQVRSNNMGLIEQLIAIMTYKKAMI